MNLLTKSKFLSGLQCPRLLWINIHKKELLPEFDISTLNKFREGHDVGELAKELFPDGVDLPVEDFMQNLQFTKEALDHKKPLFEAGFVTEDKLFSRADILVPVKDRWDIIEVKSGTKVKEINVWDTAFQKYCYEQSGLKIRKCFLMHVNNEYLRKGDINPKEFFTKENITDEVEEKIKQIPEKINEMFDILNYPEEPENKIGPHCDDPYDCALKDECWSFLPEGHVFCLYNGRKKCFELLDNKIYALKDIPDDFKLNGKQEIQRECERENKVHIHKEKLKHFLKALNYPLFYLDFETFNSAIPLFDGLKPYQQVPFQFSLHIVRKEGEKPEHISFLYDGGKDPRKEFMEKLKEVLEDAGDIIVYNQFFEKNIIKKLAEHMPEYKNWSEQVLGRFVDLLVPFRNFSYYNPKQQGSASIKKVLPALVGKSYDGMDIANGAMASIEYFNTHYCKSEKTKKLKVRKDLEKYCGLDTEAMIWIVDKLKEVSN